MHIQRVFSTIDAHAGGQPLRIITSGIPPLKGETIRERRDWLREHHDDIRRILLHEPRGHGDMYGAVLTVPEDKTADYGVVFLTNDGYSTMCGHGIIALTTALIETGLFTEQGQETRITYETPAGPIQARATIDKGRVLAVRFRNVPAFRLAKDLAVCVNGQNVTVDVAFGGAWYAIVPDHALGLDLSRSPAMAVAAAGMDVKRAVANAIDVTHPTDPDLSGLYGTIITGESTSEDATIRNATVYADSAIDRSPCGTGTSALLACRSADGETRVGDSFLNESMTGSVFTGRIVVDTTVGDIPAVITEISGRGAVTGLHQFLVDPTDRLSDGFRLR